MKAQQLAQKRGLVPVVRLVGDAYDIVVDGQLHDAYWKNCPSAATGRLRELQTGRQPIFGTSVKAGWAGSNLYFAIRCDERPGEAPRNAATADDDAATWYGDAIELSPTGTKSFHEPLKFAHFYAGKSNRFEFDPNVTDFALEFAKAKRGRKSSTFLSLAKLPGSTELQQSAAFEQAALLDKTNAPAIIDRIPIEAVRKTVMMRHGKANVVIERFADEDIAQWPFWKRGDGYFARGRAYSALRNGEAAENDLVAALTWTSDQKVRQAIRVAIGRNRESNMSDATGALSAYQAVIDRRPRLGGSDEFTAAQAIARILTSEGKFNEALATLARIDTEKQRGTWRYSTLLARGDVHRIAGDITKARQIYQNVFDDKDADEPFRRAAEHRMEGLHR